MTGCTAHHVTLSLVGNVQTVTLSRPFTGAQQGPIRGICGTLGGFTSLASRCCVLAE